MTAIVSAIWAMTVLIILWRLERNYQRWLDNQKPVHGEQYKDLTTQIASIKQEMTKLSITKAFTRREEDE